MLRRFLAVCASLTVWNTVGLAQSPVQSFDEAVRQMEAFTFPPGGTPGKIDRAAVERMQGVTQFVINRLTTPDPIPVQSPVPVPIPEGVFVPQWCPRVVVECGPLGRRRCHTVCEQTWVWVPAEPEKDRKKYGERTEASVLLSNARRLNTALDVLLLQNPGDPPAAQEAALRELAKQIYALSVIAQNPVNPGSTRNESSPQPTTPMQ